MFLGSLIYLYVFFTWYGGPFSAWLSAAYFLAPFVIAFALLSSFSLFFMSIGTMANKMMMDQKMASMMLWKLIMCASVAFFIITGGTGLFDAVIVAFLLTYIGGMLASM